VTDIWFPPGFARSLATIAGEMSTPSTRLRNRHVLSGGRQDVEVILAFADVQLDLDRYELRRAGEPVPTEPQVFDVLVLLARNADRVITKEELLDTVWGDRFVSETALTSRIKSARRCVGDDGRGQRVIATVHGRGYRLVAPVRQLRSSEVNRDERDTVATSGPLLERDGPLTELRAAADAASAGAGRVVCVEGDAGLGKSSLVHQFTEDVTGHAVVFTGAADDLTTPRPLGPIRDIVEQLPPDLRPAGGTEPTPDGVLSAFERVAAREGCALVVVLEDLHWADDATLDVVRYAARRVRRSPIVIVLTYRIEAAGRESPLWRLLGSLRGPEVSRIALQPLTPAAVASLSGGSAHHPDEVYLVTGGNPLFVTEVIAAPPGTVPRSVRDAVVARCGGLPDGVVDALCRLAVVPARLDRSLARALVPGGEETWWVAERAGLLDGDATHIWFRHELVRRAVEETMTPSERVQAHRDVARRLHAQGDEPSRIMHHAALADDVELIVTVGPLAAAEAERTGAHRQAAQHLQIVLQHAGRLQPVAQADLLTRRAHSLYLVNRFEESLACAQHAVSVAESLGDAELLARALLTLGRTELWATGPSSACAVERRALDVLGPDGDPELRAIGHADLARASGELVTIGSIAQGNVVAVDHASKALTLAEELGRRDLRGYALMYRGCGRLAVGDEAGAADIDDAVSILKAFPRADLAVRACVNASGAAFRAGRFADAERYIELGFHLGQDAEFFSGEYRLALTRASVRAAMGRWPEAVRELEALLATSGEPGIMAPLARSLLARLLARQGQGDEADHVLRAAEAAATRAEIRLLGPVAIARAEITWLAGTGDELPGLTREVLALAADTGNSAIQAELARYVQRAGFSPDTVTGAPEPWASGLRGAWREAAHLWARRGEPYEQALELADGDDATARATGHELLRSLGAAGALLAVGRRDSAAR
jgi:DNA-binding winged helix-turn-helix (wHTH) protein/tetratricopeptide (TPR) repeat protein